MGLTRIQGFRRGWNTVIGAAIGILMYVACGETSVSAPLPAARVEAIDAASITGAAGAVLPEPIGVRVFGSDNQPLPGTLVTFAASQGGSVDPATTMTDGDGIARTNWKLSNAAGANTLTVTVGTSVATTITATAHAAKPASISSLSTENQTAPAGAAVPTPPSVRVVDAFGNRVQGATVTFSVLAGGGQVTNGVRTTDAQGAATVGSWILGPVAGAQSLVARVEESGVTNNPIVFTATATNPVGSQMTIAAGNNQQAPVGRLVPIAPAVVVRNAGGQGIPGVIVDFAVATGGGSVVGARQVTDANGTAAVGGWFLGPLPGANTLTATSAGITPVTFTATATSGTPVTMAAVSQTTQSAPAGTNVSSPPSVIVRDAQGVPVPGVVVTFAVTAGGGSVVGSPATTNASGVATLTSWRLGNAVGPNTVNATATGLPSVTFTATATAGAPATVVASGGTNQTAVQGTAVTDPPAVTVRDASGNAVIGAVVNFAVTQGGGSGTGLMQLTNTQGVATVGSWTLGAGATQTMTATVTGSGITGNPVTFTALSATQIGITSAPGGPIGLGTNFNITVQLRNAAGQPVALAGVSLTIAIASGGGTLNGTLTRVTDSSGAVNFTLINVTGSAGNRTFTISGTGLTSATTAAINFN